MYFKSSVYDFYFIFFFQFFDKALADIAIWSLKICKHGYFVLHVIFLSVNKFLSRLFSIRGFIQGSLD